LERRGFREENNGGITITNRRKNTDTMGKTTIQQCETKITRDENNKGKNTKGNNIKAGRKKAEILAPEKYAGKKTISKLACKLGFQFRKRIVAIRV
jgi:hypothetical protein